MGKLPSKKKLGQFRSPGAEIWLFKKKNMDRSIDLAVQHNAKVIMVMVLMTNQPNWKQAMLPVHKLRHPAGQRLQHHWRPPGWGATRKMLLVMIMLETMKNDNDDVVSIKIYKATSFKAWGVRQLLGDGGRRREPVQVLAQHHHGGGSLGLHLRGHPVGYVAARTDRSGSVPPHYCPSFKGLFSDLPWHPPCLTLPTIICSQSLGTLVMKRKSERGHLSVTLLLL